MRQISNGRAAGLDANAETLQTVFNAIVVK